MRKLIVFSLLALFLAPKVSDAQCAFDMKRAQLMSNPDFAEKARLFEEKIKYLNKNPLERKKAGTVLEIPVVVHVLHKGEAEGTGTNISDAQIQSAIDRLNEVYRGQDPNSPVDFEIQFVLAQRDPNCNATTGINRVDASGVAGYSTDGVYFSSAGADENTLKDLSRWPETDYFNIWIVSEIDGNNGGAGYQGYANFFNGNAYEGSVMMYNVFGYDPGNANSYTLKAPYDCSTPIHEFGHYFHLYHTFQGDDANGDGTQDQCPDDLVVGDGSDGCADTEIHMRYTSTCPTNNDCNGNAPYGLNTKNNYMSYFSCTDRLTSDQKTRVQNAMTGTSIVSSLGGTAPPAQLPNTVAIDCSPVTGPTGLSGGYGGIMDVTFSNRTNSTSHAGNDGTTYGTDGYLDFSQDCNKYAEVDEGATFDVSVTTWYNDHNVKVYVDWDNSGTFDGGEEELSLNITGTASGGNDMASGQITVPAGATTSQYLRIRFNADPGTVNGPCEAPTYGQVEDYAIYVNPLALAPVAAFSASATSVCDGTSITFTDASTNTPTSWAWDIDNDGNTDYTTQNPSHTYTSPGTYSVKLTATNANGSDVLTKTNYITVNALPTVTANATFLDVCSGNQTTLTGGGATSYSWDNGVTDGVAFTPGATATYTVTGTDGNSCTNTASITVTVNSLPDVSNTSKTDETCTGNDGTATVTPSGGSGNYGYQWDAGTGSQTTQTATGLAAGNYSVVVTDNGSTCTNSTSVIVSDGCVPALPTSKISSWMNCPYVITDQQLRDYIYYETVTGAEAFEIRLQGGANGTLYYYITNTSINKFRMSWVNGVEYGTTYTVDVRVKFGGQWGNYDATCQITTPAAPPLTTKISSTFCGQTVGASNYVYCGTVQGATAYMFRVEETTNPGVIYSIRSYTINKFKPVWLGMQPGGSYTVYVQAKVNGTYQGWGQGCTFSLASPRPGQEIDLDAIMAEEDQYVVEEDYSEVFNASLTLYPNPSNGDAVNIHAANIYSQEANIEVYNLNGSLLFKESVVPYEGVISKQILLPINLQNGMYMIRIIGENGIVVNERLVIQK